MENILSHALHRRRQLRTLLCLLFWRRLSWGVEESVSSYLNISCPFLSVSKMLETRNADSETYSGGGFVGPGNFFGRLSDIPILDGLS